MNTKSSNKNFNSLFQFSNEEEKYRHDAEILMFRFLSEVEKSMQEQNINKKDLASRIGTSASFITQLFRGSKLINLITLAKIQDKLNLDFKINCSEKESDIIDKAEFEKYLKENMGNYFIYFKNPQAPNKSKKNYLNPIHPTERKIA